ncbi:TetR family transcriptional regulator [Micromonospora fluostatini]|uniref:TetR family transcriptional regulator n=1 Tax=Micromonospora fluostatini TaxID=1629071 RepID=A0ABY2DKY1_9ACTN|nr:TetR family transcriptional regulator [Micromonospora fluostatini]
MTPAEFRGKRARTRDRLVGHALDLFEQQGFEGTTVGQIAARAQVSEMTFFRYFASKEMVVLDDPYDPVIAEAVAGQPAALPPLVRVARGLRAALAQLDDPEDQVTRRRVRIVAGSPALRAAMIRTNAATESTIADRLIADGVPALPARVAAAVAIAALTCALLEWATATDGTSLTGAVTTALDTIEAVRHD